jgi:3-methyladenine DNA glycosylase Tag
MTEEIKITIMETSADMFANAMREKAKIVNQRHSETIVNNLLKIIEVKASEGNFSAFLWVKGGRQSIAYKDAQSILTSLGYTVSGDIKTGDDRQWLLSW